VIIFPFAARHQQEWDQDGDDVRLMHEAPRSMDRTGGYSQRPTLSLYF
jgi:hypothetical protein